MNYGSRFVVKLKVPIDYNRALRLKPARWLLWLQIRAWARVKRHLYRRPVHRAAMRRLRPIFIMH